MVTVVLAHTSGAMAAVVDRLLIQRQPFLEALPSRSRSEQLVQRVSAQQPGLVRQRLHLQQLVLVTVDHLHLARQLQLVVKQLP